MNKLNLFFLLASCLVGQSKIDLRGQARNFDFSQAGITKPVRLVSVLPSTCDAGEIVLLANGGSLYTCSAANIWQVVGAGATAQLREFTTSLENSTRLKIGDQCVTIAPCRVRIGSTIFTLVSGGATLDVTAGSGLVLIYFNPDGQLTVGFAGDLVLACNGCQLESGILSFPPESLPLYSWEVSNGAWVESGATDLRALLSRNVVRAGAGLRAVDNGTTLELQVDSTVIPSYRRISAPLTFGLIAAQSCASDQTITLTGAEPGDALAPAWPTLESGLQPTAWVAANDTIKVRLCNMSAADITPAVQPFGLTLLR